MLYSYAQCIRMYGTDRKLKQALMKGKLFKIEKGVYSDSEHVSELSVISMKYSKAIFTLNSVFYYYGLTDTIPNYYFLPTPKEVTKINYRLIIIKKLY